MDWKPNNDAMLQLLALPLDEVFIAVGHAMGQVQLDPDDEAMRPALLWAGTEIFQTDVAVIRAVMEWKRHELEQTPCMTEAAVYDLALEIAVELVGVVTMCPASAAAVIVVKMGLDDFCDKDLGKPCPISASYDIPQYIN